MESISRLRRAHSRGLPPRTAAIVAAAFLALAPAVARADDARTVTVVGTSDVADSGLVQGVLEPGFEHAFPQYDLQYVSLGTGPAITFAEAGTASGLLVHAASLENQFVAQGFSNEPFGRAIFYGDYVLAGTKSDPAGVLTNAPHDIVTAFERIAQAGSDANRGVHFVSRGGTPGTTVQEHLIWSLITPPAGVNLCTLSDASGGGMAPSIATGSCPNGPPRHQPAWYHTTGLTQGPNVTAADACNFAHPTTPTAFCYVMTDRGTFNFVQSGGAGKNLKIVVRDNSPTARGGGNLLVNSFHAYAIKPAKFASDPNVHINVAGATAFLNWVTSPAAQAAVRTWLSSAGDPPFLPDAAPAITSSAVPATVTAGTPVTIAGSIRNVVPGTPVLNGVPVTVSSPGHVLGTTTTDARGNYRLSFTPVRNASYTVSTGQIAKIENATLSPVFGDLLHPGAHGAGTTIVQSTIHVAGITTRYRRATVTGTVAPSQHAHGVVTVLGRRAGSSGAFKSLGTSNVAGSAFSATGRLAPGRWEIEARFDDPGQVAGAISPAQSVRVPGGVLGEGLPGPARRAHGDGQGLGQPRADVARRLRAAARPPRRAGQVPRRLAQGEAGQGPAAVHHQGAPATRLPLAPASAVRPQGAHRRVPVGDAHRPRALMRLRWSAAVVAALVAATVAVPPGGRAAAEPAFVVKVHLDGTTPAASFSAADLGDTDVPPGTDVPASWSVHKVLGQAGVSAASADVVGGGRSFVLSGADLDKPTASFESGQLPAVWAGTDRSWAVIPPAAAVTPARRSSARSKARSRSTPTPGRTSTSPEHRTPRRRRSASRSTSTSRRPTVRTDRRRP